MRKRGVKDEGRFGVWVVGRMDLFLIELGIIFREVGVWGIFGVYLYVLSGVVK